MDEPSRGEVKKALDDIAIGFIILDKKKSSDLGSIERKFINSLAPIANEEVYKRLPNKDTQFKLQTLYYCWPSEVKEDFPLEKITQLDLEELKGRHL
jgi:hypothetical protein